MPNGKEVFSQTQHSAVKAYCDWSFLVYGGCSNAFMIMSSEIKGGITVHIKKCWALLYSSIDHLKIEIEVDSRHHLTFFQCMKITLTNA